jgi:hypothetical protein
LVTFFIAIQLVILPVGETAALVLSVISMSSIKNVCECHMSLLVKRTHQG